MELRINLADEAEINAAAALLQTILGAAKKPSAPCTVGAVTSTIVLEDVPDFLPTQPSAESVFAAPAPAPVCAPQMAAAPSVPLVPDVELDSAGMPWDPELHVSTKTKIADGTWKKKPQRSPGATATPVALTAPAVPVPPAVPATPVAPVAPLAQAVPVMTPSEGPTTFEQAVPLITKAMVAGKVPATALSTACTDLGLPGVAALQQKPELVPLVWAHLQTKYPGAL